MEEVQNDDLLNLNSREEGSYGTDVVADFERRQKEETRLSVLDTAGVQLQQSAANSLYQFVADAYEGDTEVSDYSEHYETLVQGVPSQYWDDLTSQGNLDQAQRYKARLLEDLEQQGALAAQTGAVRTATKFASGLIDLDMPLMLASGGTLAAGRTMAKAGQMAMKAGLNRTGQRLAESAAIGATGGALSGAIVGGADAISRADSDFGTFMTDVAINTLLGTGLGAAAEGIPAWRERGIDQIKTANQKVLKDVMKGVETGEINKRIVDVDELSDDMNEYFDSVNAARVEGTNLGPEYDHLNQTTRGDILKYRYWEAETGHKANVAEDTQNPITEFLTMGTVMGIDNKILKGLNRAVNLGGIDHNKLLQSKTAHSSYAAVEIFEGAAGVGRQGSTAGILRERYFKQIMAPMVDSMEAARKLWQKQNGYNMARRQLMTADDNRKFAREVRLALDAYANGLEVPAKYKELVDQINYSNGVAQDIMQRNGVTGAKGAEFKKGYYRHQWEAKNFDDAITKAGNNKAGRKVLKKAIQRAILNKNPNMSNKVSNTLAGAYVRRYAKGGLEPNTGKLALISTDSRSAIESALEDLGVKGKDLAAIREELDALAGEGAMKGYLNERIEMDMNVDIPGTDLKIVDLLSDDIGRATLQYAGDVAGSSALAKKGLRDTAEVNKFIDGMLAEEHAMGEGNFHSREELEAMFSQFTGGAHGGYMWGVAQDGVSQATSLAGKLTRASLLQRTGLTSLMDATNIVIANGVGTAMSSLMKRFKFGKDLTPGSASRLLDEMESIGVIAGKDHKVFQPHLAVNDSQNAQQATLATLHAGVSVLEKNTHLASGMMHVTAELQKTAIAATTTNVLRTLAGQRTNLSKSKARRLKDLGISYDMQRKISSMIKDGTIGVNGGRVEPNFANWGDAELVDEFASAMERGMHQQVQKEVTGESSVWMNTDVGKLLTILKSFGYTAQSKQLARSAKIGGYGGVVATTAVQTGWAYGVLQVSNIIQGKEMDPSDRARLALAYSANGGGIIGQVDALTNALGADWASISPYGEYASFGATPVTEMLANIQRVPGAAAGLVDGTFDYNDRKALQALPFLNYYGMSRIWDSIQESYKD